MTAFSRTTVPCILPAHLFHLPSTASTATRSRQRTSATGAKDGVLRLGTFGTSRKSHSKANHVEHVDTP
jgi:hypothetical protein